jgi:hypothetical protein
LDHNDLQEAWENHNVAADNTLKNFIKAIAIGVLASLVGIVTDSIPILLLSVAASLVLLPYYGVPLIKEIVIDLQFLKIVNRRIAKLKS